tara:strand:- start:3452 stop:4081 length:630 start_codon:yes stop_codon:yes gene_type:complete
MKKKIGVLKYGIGNLSSFTNALDKLNIEYSLISKPRQLENIEILILIGVGSFNSCMAKLEEKKFINPLNKFKNKNKFLLGICVGMQILMTKGTENGEANGLNFIKGKTIKMVSDKDHPLPHIGWNEISKISNSFKLFDEIKLKSNFYFIHSFKISVSEENIKLAETQYGKNTIVAALNKGNVFGVQFHPEKSQDVGMKIIKNFLNLANA